ncbi:MAG: transglycosylase SLT domain-containing protein [Candidatus Endonucleobacter bathymodioli]|uniref:Transglycosylase SLT domain-containing protein n=1 Tax=Candidatus Endonucleibacter bathymodioli TaxID=539814 RepID=A0AA90NMG4_9GAMM|nr:transglycosylase SLT domain-containing protein [Candidatus Endonucleobacter bathymodioli]
MTNKLLKKTVFFAITSISFLFPSTAFTIDINKLESQRTVFAAVEKKLKSKKDDLYYKSLKQLKGYPLLPYLHSLNLINKLNNISQNDIDSYVAAWPLLPSNKHLQRQWLIFLAKKNLWADYITAFERSNIRNSKYQCLYGISQYKEGNKKIAWKKATKLWLVGYSQNKSCDPLFQAWKAEKRLSQQLVFKRFWLAVAKGNTKLAKHIDKSINDNDLKKQTQLLWRIHNKPQLLASTKILNKKQESHRLIYLYGIKKLARKSIEKASNLWLEDRYSYPFSLKETAKLDQWLAIRLAKNFHDNASQYISLIDPTFKYQKVTKWRIRLALANQDWSSVLSISDELPKNDLEKNRWKYWRAIATNYIKQQHGELNYDKSILAQDIFTDLSQERDFYGFLVADISNNPFKLNSVKDSVNTLELQEFISKFDAFGRIQEWLYHQRYHKAQSELNKLKPSLSSKERKMVAYLAQQWKWHYQAILTAANESLWNDIQLRFPSPLSNVFDKYSKKQKIDSFWVMSIARQESAFNPRARSHAGAKGLMQLMPATAKQTARNYKIKYRRESDLFRPKVNIALGTAHLSKLITQFETNKIFATAAYNAGASRVNSWRKKRGHLPLDIWIETIPYDETRQYVQNVLAFQVIYMSLNNQNAQMFSTKEAEMMSLSVLSSKPFPLKK